MSETSVIDVIIPVYRGVEETRRCVDSVLAAPQSTPFDIVLIDDCSPDDGIRGYLADLSSRGDVTLIRNERNLGFVASANRGMSLHPDRDVVLLNSDTEVTNDWLDRLRCCAHARPDIGTVTPFSNNATICSYPYEGWPGGVPGTLGLAALDRLFATVNAGQSLDIPTAVGFCMYIRRDCLDAVGPFDEDRFGRGYGEENDFCMRAAEAGWHSLLAGDVFVYHKGGVSFSGERHALQEAAMAALLERHPYYLDRVHDYIRRDPAAGLRLAADRARLAADPQEAAAVILERGAQPDSSPRKAGDGAALPPARLHVTHSWGGGTDRWINDFQRADSAHRNLILCSHTDRNHAAYRLELRGAGAAGPPLAIWDLAVPIRTTDIGHSEYASILRGVIASFGIRDIIVSSLIGHALDALDTGHPTAVVMHDLYPFCPALFACFGTPCAQCTPDDLRRCLRSNPYNVFWHNSTTQDWLRLRDEYATRLGQPWVRIAAPTQGIHDRWTELLPATAAMPWRRIPHGLDPALLGNGRIIRPDPDSDARLRIVIPGRLPPHKGMHLLRDSLPALTAEADILLLGCGDFGQVFQEMPGLQIIPEYTHIDLAASIHRFAPDCAMLLSVLPESFSYTLSEMFALGLPVLATRTGAFTERIEEGATGLLFEPNPDALLSCVRRVAADRRILTGMAKTLEAGIRYSATDMLREYDALLATPVDDGAGQRSATSLTTAPPCASHEPSDTTAPPDDRERIRREVRGSLFLPDAARIVFAYVPPNSATVVERLVRVARTCTAARNDVCFCLTGVGPGLPDSPEWHPFREEVLVMLSTRRLFFTDPWIPEERLRLAADACLSPLPPPDGHTRELAALRTGLLLLGFDENLPPAAAGLPGRIGLLSDETLAAGADILSDWLDGPGRTVVVAVVVTHHPRPEALSELLAALCPQVEALVLVDNGSGPDLAAWIADHAPAGVLPIFLDDNRGVAAAQNAGIRKARELGADRVLLSDQDSLPAPDMVAQLLAALRAKEAEGLRVAAVGPRYEDPRDGTPGPFVQLHGLRYRHQFCADEKDAVETDHLISSGCLIPARVLDMVGEMSEGLFIDHVDTEWGLRARHAGYRSFGICAARMRHTRGEMPVRLAGHTIPVHEPLRHYYQTRNTVWLIRQPWLPLRWKLANTMRLLRNILVYSLVAGRRRERWRLVGTGILHGMRDRLGRL